jgi:hypothetical protein
MDYYVNVEVDGETQTLPVSQIKIEDHEVWCLIQFDEDDYEWQVVDIDDIYDDEVSAYDAFVY